MYHIALLGYHRMSSNLLRRIQISIQHRYVRFLCITVSLANGMSQLWTEILKDHPTPTFTKKAVYQIWSSIDSKKWKRDKDEFTSAKILLEEAKVPGNHGLYTVQPIPLHTEPGMVAIAFALPDILRKWGGRVREVSLDSACEFFGDKPANHGTYITCREHKRLSF